MRHIKTEKAQIRQRRINIIIPVNKEATLDEQIEEILQTFNKINIYGNLHIVRIRRIGDVDRVQRIFRRQRTQ